MEVHQFRKKGKVLSVLKLDAVKVCGEVKVKLHVVLTSALYGDGLLFVRSAHHTRYKRSVL